MDEICCWGWPDGDKDGVNENSANMYIQNLKNVSVNPREEKPQMNGHFYIKNQQLLLLDNFISHLFLHDSS